MQAGHEQHASHEEGHEHAEHQMAHVDHTGHEQMFRQRFWVSLILTVPVLLFSSGFQELLGFTLPAFPGSQWIAPAFSLAIFIYGGLPFLRLAGPEIKNRQPGMMTLISLAISIAFLYSFATLFIPGQMDFFWELATLIDIMLLGHWIEMRSIRQASGALNALAKLMPDTAERIGEMIRLNLYLYMISKKGIWSWSDQEPTFQLTVSLLRGNLLLMKPCSPANLNR